ncbi:MAG: isoprenylcysteine carboxylmethyltransferase family protein [Candidatus Eisenbacteria bacterium]|uniref:Isoprenylcysteine carboxylmethyltransferase family protein n=1 Tax=Eiseniibacteriota bacterium TaxID=2212470 RepID=A0A538SE21_UNCEI|nr:MAG: isoprenylcysteine carboxylmethyltransferase family protein [Candidatus Eisenbacteria bacterium]
MRAIVLLRAFVVGTIYVSLQVWFFPRWFGVQGDPRAPLVQPLRWMGLLPAAIGAAIILSCFRDFAVAGRGTPAPFDPPRGLVTRGPYRWVRNPMYLGLWLLLIGEAVLFARPTWSLFVYAPALIIVIHLFVVLYEEPTLRRKFGADYERYVANVKRWLPRKPTV